MLTSSSMNEPIELSAMDRGAGDAVALVHGGIIHSGPAWAKSFRPLAEAGFRAIAVDRRGHGRSPMGDADRIPVHLHADDLRLTLELREAAQAHLVGVSYGALVCLEFALSWPERVLSLTLIEPPLFTWLEDDPDYGIWARKFEEIHRDFENALPLEDWVPRWLSLIDSRMARATTPAHPTWTLVERNAHMVFKEEAGWQYRPDREMMAALNVPALVLSGDLSEPPMQVLADMAAEALPGAERKWITGGGHDAHARRSETFNAYLIEFLSRHAKS